MFREEVLLYAGTPSLSLNNVAEMKPLISPSRLIHPLPPLPPFATMRTLSMNWQSRKERAGLREESGELISVDVKSTHKALSRSARVSTSETCVLVDTLVSPYDLTVFPVTISTYQL